MQSVIFTTVFLKEQQQLLPLVSHHSVPFLQLTHTSYSYALCFSYRLDSWSAVALIRCRSLCHNERAIIATSYKKAWQTQGKRATAWSDGSLGRYYK